nr:AAC_HP1_G0006710.mRNA.1.CDS.1 [Saccharomyces cerevisiae]
MYHFDNLKVQLNDTRRYINTALNNNMWLKSLLLCLYSLVLCQVHAAPSSGKQITSKDVDLQKKYEPSPPPHIVE